MARISSTYAGSASRSLALQAPAATPVVTTGATNTTPYGFTTAAQANALVATVNALVQDVANDKQALNQLLDELNARNAI